MPLFSSVEACQTQDMETPALQGACNAHCHVFGPRDRFPYPSGAAFVPEQDAPKEALYALNDRLGLQRCVVVQSSCHGFDNGATQDAIAGRPRDYRGIALLPVDAADAELRRLDKAGFRGVRFNFMKHLGAATPIDAILALAARLAPLGWHLQVHGDPAIVPDVVERLLQGPVPVVIDHIGRLDAGLGVDQPFFRHFLRLMENPKTWMKVSGIDRISKSGPPYDDAMPSHRNWFAISATACCGATTGRIPIMPARSPTMRCWRSLSPASRRWRRSVRLCWSTIRPGFTVSET